MKFEIATSDIADFFRNTLLYTGGLFIFLAGCFIYGSIITSGEKPLTAVLLEKQISEPKNIILLINRRENALYLYADTVLLKKYRAAFGNITQPRLLAGERHTPVGEYKTTIVEPHQLYYKFIGIDFPNLDDAGNALRLGIITQKEYNDFKFQYFYGQGAPGNSPMGGGIGIHGIGQLDFLFKHLPFVFNWTDGSIAISNEAISEIAPLITKGVRVVIR